MMSANKTIEPYLMALLASRIGSISVQMNNIIRMGKMRIRVPEVWYGDYLAMMGAARIGERELTNLITKYGKDTIKAFCEQWHAYGRQRMREGWISTERARDVYGVVLDTEPELYAVDWIATQDLRRKLGEQKREGKSNGHQSVR
jgi:hypothetical protein